MRPNTKQQEEMTILVRLSSLYRWSIAELYVARTLLKLKLARHRKNTVVFIAGTPKHSNLGDQAIALAESEFIKARLLSTTLIKVPLPLIMRDQKDVLSRLVRNGDVLLGIGGGNMGDTYIQEELCRRKFIEGFPKNKIIIFPQTIYFSDTPTGRKELKKSIAIYSKHIDLTLIAREETSYKEMLRVFSKNKVILTPDIVLSLNSSSPSQPREGALLCLRDDEESKLSANDRQNISTFCDKNFGKVTETDTISAASFFEYRYKERAVKNKLSEFKGAKFVVTDRLHGMVFSAITGTPCVALTNFNHKVKGTYKWLEHLPYIQFCDDVSKLEKLFKQINIDDVYQYDPAYYSKYWKQIDTAITSAN